MKEIYITIDLERDYNTNVFETYKQAQSYMNNAFNKGRNIILRYSKINNSHLGKASQIPCVKHVDIQKYIIQGVKHYRARVQGEDWKYETNPRETLDMFRNKIMDTLDCGIVTHFLEDWDPMEKAPKHLE